VNTHLTQEMTRASVVFFLQKSPASYEDGYDQSDILPPSSYSRDALALREAFQD
jgi:hypothetical protein